ncbi:SDR family NAD(P)-dependent oxidoreductase [Nitratireductor sp. ZSWI3]|uniref:SDR family NAD(P)-dependent oxidoreductase n=1 Tax=Nitratireductor sp. ZSWI3 TaxID=2966359 RepID=UPI00214FB812|nr:SDR family NAD(P)-dependent oxidoreductase [Nitratireductor sp. ZSWI3]MCR4265167.1 SDR family oxidoreductase [Nitratireductor sp. ZSWI3]
MAGKVAIVTGAGCVGSGWGNGRATCVRFAEEGARIFAVDIKSETMGETLERVRAVGGEVEPHLCDVTDSHAVQNMVSACTERFGAVDVLVNNVGGSAKGGPTELDEESWNRQLNLNLKSVYLTCRSVLPHMAARGAGAIVNTASTSGIRYTGSPQVAYASAKAAIIQFSRVVAVEFASKGVRVNTVVPGQLHTPMVETRLAGQRMGGDVDALLASRLKRIPLGWMGDGRDTANAALFLASDEARFITGTEIVVDGGMSVRCD